MSIYGNHLQIKSLNLDKIISIKQQDKENNEIDFLLFYLFKKKTYVDEKEITFHYFDFVHYIIHSNEHVKDQVIEMIVIGVVG